MLKPLLYMLTIVVISAGLLNFDFNEKDSEITDTPSLSKKSITINSSFNNSVTPLPNPSKNNQKNILLKELQKLLNEARTLFQENKDSEALALYEKIIDISKESNELEILKIFVHACFEKATIHYIFPTYDVDAALESYELVIQKLEYTYNKELLLLYQKAKLNKLPFLSKKEALVVYDELIEKFENDKSNRFSKEIEKLLFNKSFALMGVNNEEAMEVLDQIITQYEDKSKLPDTVQFSILNNIELSIITGNEADEYVDLAQKYMADSPDTKPLLGMLDIIKNAQNLPQDEALEAWKNEYANYTFPDWDFSELRKWVNQMEVPESQIRITQYLDAFEKQKYKNSYQPSITTTPNSEQYTKSLSSNTQELEEEISYEELQDYHDNPYQSEILNNNDETNSQIGELSQTYDTNDY